MKRHPEDALEELFDDIAQEIGFAHARLYNYSMPENEARVIIERQWISRLTDLLIANDCNKAQYPDWRDADE